MASSADLVRRAYDTWNRDDFDSARLMMHPEVEWYSSGAFPGLPDVSRGPDEVHRWWMALKEPWERFTIHVEGLWEEGPRAVSAVRFEAVGRESGVGVELQFANTWEFENDLIRCFRSYVSLDAARAAAGL